MNIRVLHLPVVIANTAPVLSKYLNRIGIDSKVVSYFRTWLGYEGDINLELDHLAPSEKQKKVNAFVSHFFESEINSYDIFHIHFFETLSTGSSFGGWRSHPDRDEYWDLQTLKDRGKKIVVSSWGSDVRNNSKIIYYQLMFDGHNPALPYPPLNKRDQYIKLWKFSQYADAIINGDTEHLRHTPYGKMIPIPIDPEPYDAVRVDINQELNKFSILTAPSNQFYKGTKYALRLIDKLKTQYGNSIDYRIVHGQSFAEALKSYAGTGLAIEGINFTTGLFALEAMYLGRRVLCCMKANEFSREDPKRSPLFLSINNEDEMYEQAVACIEGHVPIAAESMKDFVMEHFSAATIAMQYKEIYEKVLANEPIAYTVNREWLKEFNLFIRQKKIDHRDYYPQVTDLLLRKHLWQALFHEVNQGMGLNNGHELLAKFIAAQEAVGQQDQANQTRKNNPQIVLNDEFKESYSRAKALIHEGLRN